MFSFELFFSRRLRLADGGRRPSAAVAVGVAGIAVAVVVMLLSIAVTGGFQQEIRRKLMGFDAQIALRPASSYYGDEQEATISLASPLEKVVGQVLGTNAQLSTASRQAGILKTDSDFLGVVFHGYGPGHDPSFEASCLVEGELPDWEKKGDEAKNKVVVSRSMASKLRLSLGDRLLAYFVVNEAVKARKLEIAGIYDSRFGEYDATVAYASQRLLAGVAGRGAGEADRLEINGLAVEKIQPSALELQHALNLAFARGSLPEPVGVETVLQSAAAYFNWLDLLDTNVVVILVLMGCVSGFTLVSSLIILILERVRTIGVLKALGASNGQLRRIFLMLGSRVAVWGLLIGNAVAGGLIWLQGATHLLPMDPQTYYLDFVPVAVSPWAFLVLDGAAFLLAFGLMTLPTAMIGRIAPASTLRWE